RKLTNRQTKSLHFSLGELTNEAITPGCWRYWRLPRCWPRPARLRLTPRRRLGRQQLSGRGVWRSRPRGLRMHLAREELFDAAHTEVWRIALEDFDRWLALPEMERPSELERIQAAHP